MPSNSICGNPAFEFIFAAGIVTVGGDAECNGIRRGDGVRKGASGGERAVDGRVGTIKEAEDEAEEVDDGFSGAALDGSDLKSWDGPLGCTAHNKFVPTECSYVPTNLVSSGGARVTVEDEDKPFSSIVPRTA